MEEGAQLNMNGTPQDDTLWLREFRDNSSVSRMEMCSLKVPNSNKLEQRVLQWAGCTVQDNVGSVWAFW